MLYLDNLLNATRKGLCGSGGTIMDLVNTGANLFNVVKPKYDKLMVEVNKAKEEAK